jgi:hypothetical protein
MSSDPISEPVERRGPVCGCDAELSSPIVCTLSADEAHDRSSAWAELLARAVEREATATGVRLRFDADPHVASTAADLSVREAECCAFFAFTITIDAHAVWLTVDAPPEGRPVLDALFA